MLLYHGSDVVVKHPVLLPERRALDFGPGFYLTSSKSQAEKWAKIVKLRRKSSSAVLNTYEFIDSEIGKLNVLKFESANAEWLEFVCSNRRRGGAYENYDLVIGPVANDSTLPVIDDYMDGVYTAEEAVKRLLPQNLTDQYSFLTEEALSFLAFTGKEEIL